MPQRHSTAILVAILGSQLMVVLDGTIVNIALPHIQTALHFSSIDLSWVLNAYSLSFGGFLLLGARAGDLLGRRGVFVGGICIFTVASLAGGVATTSGLLLAARAVQGLGAALASPSALALLTVTFSEGRERTRALASYGAVSIGGSAVGLVVGGMLVEWASWRWIFFVNVPIGVALVVLAKSVLPETVAHPGRLDIIGGLTSTIGMAAVVYGLIRAATYGWGDTGTIVSLALGAALLIGFVLAERRAKSPIVPLRLFASRPRSTSYLVRMLLVGASLGMFFFLSQFLQEVLGYSPLETGFAFVPMTAVLFSASQVSARLLSGRVSWKIQALVGLICSSVALLLLTEVSGRSHYGEVLLSLALFGLGNGLAFVPLTTLSLTGVTDEDAGAGSGMVNAAQQIGGSLGLAVLVTVFGAASRSRAAHLAATIGTAARRTLPLVAGTQMAFRVATGLMCGSLLMVALLRVPHGEEGSIDSQVLEDAEAATAGLA